MIYYQKEQEKIGEEFNTDDEKIIREIYYLRERVEELRDEIRRIKDNKE